MTRAVSALAVVFLATLVAEAQAQVAPYAYGYSPYGYYGGGHASTAAEGYANGMSNIIQSAGSYNLQTSQAAINVEQARSMDLDNRLKGTQTYFEMRKINTASRKSEESPGLSTEDSWRYAQMYVPKRPTPTQLDPVTGKIYWPVMLRDGRYDGYRKKIDDLFVQREASHGGIGYETYTQIVEVTNGLLDSLKKNIDLYNNSDYVKLKSFVESLAYEAKFPAV
jgi:hypothetical protein